MDPKDPQPKREAFSDYATFRLTDKAWNKREQRRIKAAAKNLQGWSSTPLTQHNHLTQPSEPSQVPERPQHSRP
jgi:hypothetical protein